MSFNANTDVNYANVQAARAAMSGAMRGQFDEFLIKWACLQATNGATLSNAAFSAGITAALLSAENGVYGF